MKFEFATSSRILFGAGCSRELGTVCREWGKRVGVLTGRHPERWEAHLALLAAAGLEIVMLPWQGAHSEPDLGFALQLAARLRSERADLVVGFGGGGVLDAAKACAALAVNDEDPYRFLEVVGRGEPLRRAALPIVAVPTTAGTGSEVTRNAVLTLPEQKLKVSLRHGSMLPKVALVDPELSYSLPAALTASTGMDALTQCLEPMVSVRSNLLVDSIARGGLGRVARSLRTAVLEPRNSGAREDLAYAALCGGLALANSGLGAVHGIAGPLGGLCPGVSHGALCAALLAPVVEANLRALRLRAPAHPALETFRVVAEILTGSPGVAAEAGVGWIYQLVSDLGIPNLAGQGVASGLRGAIVANAQRASSMKGNPVPLLDSELEWVLSKAGLSG